MINIVISAMDSYNKTETLDTTLCAERKREFSPKEHNGSSLDEKLQRGNIKGKQGGILWLNQFDKIIDEGRPK